MGQGHSLHVPTLVSYLGIPTSCPGIEIQFLTCSPLPSSFIRFLAIISLSSGLGHHLVFASPSHLGQHFCFQIPVTVALIPNAGCFGENLSIFRSSILHCRSHSPACWEVLGACAAFLHVKYPSAWVRPNTDDNRSNNNRYSRLCHNSNTFTYFV